MGGEVTHSVGIFAQLFDSAPRVVGEDLKHGLLVMQNLFGSDLDVGGLPLSATARLMQNDGGVGQGRPLTLGSCRQNHCRGSHGLADTNRVYGRFDVAEGVADGEGLCFKADGITRVPTRSR